MTARDPSGPLAARPPVAGGVDVDLPGDGVRLRGTRWSGTGPPVVLLHGLASTRRFWDLVVPGLAGMPVVAVDQRGHGDSDKPSGPYDGATVVRDVVTALDALALSRVVVVGHSWGATTAARVAATAPDRVLAVVALDGGTGLGRSDGAGPGRPDGSGREELRRLLTPPRTALPPEDLRLLLAAGPLRAWWTPAVEAAVLPLFEVGADGLARPRLPFEAHMAIVDDLLDADPDALWRAVTCPAWLVACRSAAGTDDDVRTAAREAGLARAAASTTSPRVLRWDGAVHDVPLQWPALVAGLIRAACDETVLARVAGEGGGS